MNKKLIIWLIALFISIGALIHAYIDFKNKNKPEEEYEIYEKILEKIDNKETFLVYIQQDNNENNIISFYEKLYKIEFIKYDDKYIDKLRKICADNDFEKDFLETSYLMFFKEGKLFSIINLVYEYQLKELLIDNELIIDKYPNLENDLIEYEKFKEIFQKKENSLIVIGKDNEFKLKLYDIANKYKYTYNIIYEGIVAYYDSYNNLIESADTILESGTLVIVNNSKVVSYLTSDNEEEIISFLKKNNIIS